MKARLPSRLLAFPLPTLLLLAFLLPWSALHAADRLQVDSAFEGGSVAALEVDDATRTIRFSPGGDPARGWPCWWYFRVSGVTPGETITLQLRGSTATTKELGSALSKPIAPAWAMPAQATFSTDGSHWLHTEKGTLERDVMTYTVAPTTPAFFIAWGPPYTPASASAFVKEMAAQSPHARAEELCRSRENRGVPMLHVQEGARTAQQRFGVWVQARQHAWESGSSWVAQGFGEWITGPDPEAAWLRSHAEIFLVPIMDVDNTATGNGGKDAIPHDHNRDWSDAPHWNEVAAAQKQVRALIAENRMDVFLDLHNPAPGDPTFFYILEANSLAEPMASLLNRFITLSYSRISKIKPLIPMSNRPKSTGPSYHPLWRQISANWVSMNGNPTTVSACLETLWNYPNCTTDGYRAVGSQLAQAVREYLAERPLKP
jgi:hypothetical protein